MLKAIPKARVQEMQRTIATLGHRMHYGLEDTPNDALEILLNTITDHADVVDKGNAAREDEALYNKELDSPLPRAKDCEDLNLRSRLVETWPESRLHGQLTPWSSRRQSCLEYPTSKVPSVANCQALPGGTEHETANLSQLELWIPHHWKCAAPPLSAS